MLERIFVWAISIFIWYLDIMDFYVRSLLHAMVKYNFPMQAQRFRKYSISVSMITANSTFINQNFQIVCVYQSKSHLQPNQFFIINFILHHTQCYTRIDVVDAIVHTVFTFLFKLVSKSYSDDWVESFILFVPSINAFNESHFVFRLHTFHSQTDLKHVSSRICQFNKIAILMDFHIQCRQPHRTSSNRQRRCVYTKLRQTITDKLVSNEQRRQCKANITYNKTNETCDCKFHSVRNNLYLIFLYFVSANSRTHTTQSQVYCTIINTD